MVTISEVDKKHTLVTAIIIAVLASVCFCGMGLSYLDMDEQLRRIRLSFKKETWTIAKVTFEVGKDKDFLIVPISEELAKDLPNYEGISVRLGKKKKEELTNENFYRPEEEHFSWYDIVRAVNNEQFNAVSGGDSLR